MANLPSPEEVLGKQLPSPEDILGVKKKEPLEAGLEPPLVQEPPALESGSQLPSQSPLDIPPISDFYEAGLRDIQEAFEPSSIAVAGVGEGTVKEVPDEVELSQDVLVKAVKRGWMQAEQAGILSLGRAPEKEDIKKLAEIQRRQAAIPPSEAYRKFTSSQSFGELLSTLAEDPIPIIAELTTESMTALVRHGITKVPYAVGVGAAAGAVTGPGVLAGIGVGAIAGLGLTSLNLEYSGSIMESLAESGVDVSNEESLASAFSDDEKMDEVRIKALKKGVPVAVFDMISGGVAGRILSKPAKNVIKRSAQLSAEMGVQMGLGATGEATGQLVSEGKITSIGAIGAEAVGEIGGGAATVAIGTAYRNLVNKKASAADIRVLSKSDVGNDLVDAGETSGEISRATAATVKEDIQQVSKAEKSVPQDIKGRDKIVENILEREALEKEHKDSDPSIKEAVDEKVKELNEENKAIFSGQPEGKEITIGGKKVNYEDLTPEQKEAADKLLSQFDTQKETGIKEAKADIEKRRQEDLNNRVVNDGKTEPKVSDGEFKIIGDDRLYRINESTERPQVFENGFWSNTELAPKLFFHNAKRTGWQKSKDKINAKYDAELVALETQKETDVKTKKKSVGKKSEGKTGTPVLDKTKEQQEEVTGERVEPDLTQPTKTKEDEQKGTQQKDDALQKEKGSDALQEEKLVSKEEEKVLDVEGVKVPPTTETIDKELRALAANADPSAIGKKIAKLPKEQQEELLPALKEKQEAFQIKQAQLELESEKAVGKMKEFISPELVGERKLTSKESIASFKEKVGQINTGLSDAVKNIVNMKNPAKTKVNGDNLLSFITKLKKDKHLNKKTIQDAKREYINLQLDFERVKEKRYTDIVNEDIRKAFKQQIGDEAFYSATPATEDHLKNMSKQIKKAFPDLEIEYTQESWDKMSKQAEEDGKAHVGWGDKMAGVFYKGKIYINPKNAGLDTPAHEASHLFLTILKHNNTPLYRKGLELIKDTFYHDYVNEEPIYKNNPEETKLEEALVQAIGEAGAGVFLKEYTNPSTYRKIVNWVKEFWGNIKKTLGIRERVDMENMKLKDFTKYVSKRILGGVPIYKKGVGTDSDYINLQKTIIDSYDTRTEKTLSAFRRQFISRGGMPKSAFQEKLKADFRIKAIMKEVEHNVKDLRKAVKRSWGKPTEQQLGAIDSVLKGEKEPTVLPKEIRDIVQKMRDHVDNMSRRMIELGLIEGDVLAKVQDNLGIYLTRSYKKYDDPKWAEKVPVEIRNKAKAFIRNQYKDMNLTDNEVNGIIDQILSTGDSPIKFLSKGRIGSRDLTALIKRKDIDPTIRALMGEWKDPVVNYMKSVSKMANYIENDKFLNDVKALGFNNYFFQKPVGKFNTQLVSETNESMKPLSGLYTTPEIQEAFEDNYNNNNFGEKGDVWAGLMRMYLKVNSSVKYGKTILSWTTAVRNFTSGVGFLTLNGHLNFKDIPGAIKIVSTDFIHDNQKARDSHKKYVKLGVVDESTSYGELRDYMKDVSGKTDDFEQFQDNWIKTVVRKGKKLAEGFYRLGDDVWKVVGFEHEVKRYSKAHPEWSQDQVEEKAAEIIRDTMPTYSLVPKLIKNLRKFPLVGTFVSFPSEIIRTTANTIALAKEEMSHEATRKIGAKRIAGLLFTMGSTGTVALMSKYALDISDDEDDALRRFMAPWTKNSQVIFLGKDDKGRYQYIDLSFQDPYNYLKTPFVAISKADSYKDGTIASLKDLLAPYLSEEILASKILDVNRNVTAEGKKIYNEEDPMWMYDALDHILEGIEPGTLTSLNRVYKSITGITSDYGKEYSPGVEIPAFLFGLRISKIDVRKSMQFKVSRYRSRIRDARSIYVSAQRKGYTGDKLETARKKSEGAVRLIQQEIDKDRMAANVLGVD